MSNDGTAGDITGRGGRDITEVTAGREGGHACGALAMYARASTRQELALAAMDAGGVLALVIGVGCGGSGGGCCSTTTNAVTEMKRPSMTADAGASAARLCSVGEWRPE